MDIPYIDDSCASDASPKRTLSPAAGRAAPLRLSRYSESSDDAPPAVHLYSSAGGDDLSVNNLLDELSTDDDVCHSLGSSPVHERAGPSPQPTLTDSERLAVESGFSELSSFPTTTGDSLSSVSAAEWMREPVAPLNGCRTSRDTARDRTPLTDGIVSDAVPINSKLANNVNCFNESNTSDAAHDRAECLKSSELWGVDYVRDANPKRERESVRSETFVQSAVARDQNPVRSFSAGLSTSADSSVFPTVNSSPTRSMGYVSSSPSNGCVNSLHDKGDASMHRRSAPLPFPDVLATVSEHPENALQTDLGDGRSESSHRRTAFGSVANATPNCCATDDYPYPLPELAVEHPGIGTTAAYTTTSTGTHAHQRGGGGAPDAAGDGGLLQDVLQALGQPRYDGSIRVDGSSNVTLGPVINIHQTVMEPSRATVGPSHPPVVTPQSTAERRAKSSRSSPFNSIGKASLASSVSSGLERVPPSRQGTLRGPNNPLMGRIVSYLRTRCLDTLTRQQPIPWCPEFRLPLQRYYIALGLLPVATRGEPAHQQIPLEEILAPLTIHESPLAACPRRILVEGEPGFGKSTLTLKLLHDWASDDAPAYLAGFQFAFLIPLWEFSGSLFNFAHRELLPRHIVGKDLMVKLWQYLAEHEDKVLFLLDGLDELRDEHRGEVMDLLSGKLFLASTVLVTSRPSHSADALPWVQRRLVIQGFAQPSVRCYVQQYFACVERPEGVARLESELEARPPLRELARCPLLCLLLCAVFEDCDGALPESEATLYRLLFDCLIRRSLLRRGGRARSDDGLPERCGRMLRQFGKIALQVCLEGRVHYNEQEIVNHVDREVLEWGFLIKVVSVSKVQKKELYQPLHRTFTDFLAALYLSSLPDQKALRQNMVPVIAHIDKLDGQPKASHSVMVMLRYLVALLNDGRRKAYQALELLAPLGLPARTLFALLRAAGSEKLATQAVATCLTSLEQVLVLTDQEDELRGWTAVLRVSVHHSGLEVVYRPAATSDALEPLLEVAARRVTSIKLSTLLGTDMSGDELRRLGADVARLLRPADACRYRLQRLEILLQNLDDSDFGRFQPVVDGLCSALPLVPPDTRLKLVLDMDMSAEQMTQLCGALQRSRGVAFLVINHLVSFEGSMIALAGLLRNLPLAGVVLRSVWNPESQTTSALDFFRSEHNLRLRGSGSIPRVRGASLTRNYSLGRGADIAGNELDIAYQLRLGREPICDPAAHVGGFHHLFGAMRAPGSILSSLKLERCRLTASDLACLGESLRVTTHLTNLTVHNVTSAQDLVPLLFALQDNTKLQLLDLTSTLTIEDAEFILLCRSLVCCHELLLLCLSKWTFKLEWEHSLRAAVEFLQKTGLQQLEVENATVHLTLSDRPRRDDAAAQLLRHLPAVKSRIDTVSASGCCVIVNDSTRLCGPDLLPLVQRVCPKLGAVQIKLRLHTTTEHWSKQVDDAALLRFFRQCADSVRLRQLRMDWNVQLTQRATLEKRLKKQLRLLHVSQVYMAGLRVELDGVCCVDAFTVTLIAHLRCLQLLGLAGGSRATPASQAAVARGIRDRFPGDKLVLYTRALSYGALRALRTVIEESDKFIATYSGGELGVYTISRVARQLKS